MAYAVLADVQARVAKFTIDANSKPSSTQATQFIADIEVMMDARFAVLGFAVPITGAKSLALCKIISAHGSAAAFLRAAFQAGEDAADETRKEEQRIYDELMAAIEKNAAILPDAPRTTTITTGAGISGLRGWPLDHPSDVETVESSIDNSPQFRAREKW